MRILVTAGNTQAPVDRVRCLTNIFSGRTGTRIALEARQHGHTVGLLTSHPEVVRDLAPPGSLIAKQWHVGRYYVGAAVLRMRHLRPSGSHTFPGRRP